MEHLGLVGLNGSQHELLFAALTGPDAIGASERVIRSPEACDALARTSG